VACMDCNKNAYRVLDGMLGKKRQLGRPRCSWEGNIKTDLKEVGQKCMSWIHLSTGPVWSCCEYSNEPSGSTKQREFLHWLRMIRYLRTTVLYELVTTQVI